MDISTPIESGSDARKNWQPINRNGVVLQDLKRQVERLQGEVNRLKTRARGDERLPFEVYLRPDFARAPEERSDDAWRMFTVRHGYCNYVKTDKCDDADGEGTTPEEITVPIETERYVIYAEATVSGSTVSSAEIKHGTDDWTGWPASLSEDGTKFRRLLAVVDTLSSGRSQALVRQYQIGDVFIDGVGGGDARYS